MSKTDIEKIKGKYFIFSNQNFVVLIGKKLYIFRADGTQIACRPDVPHAYKVAFISENKILTGGGKNAYHLISLEDGAEIWSIPQPKMNTHFNKFALSTDNTEVYDFFRWNDTLYFLKINIETRESDVYPISGGLRTTKDIMCDEKGVPCLLQTHYERIGGEQVSQNGILYQYQDSFETGSEYYWKYKWQHQGTTIAENFLLDTETILTNDLYVFKPRTGKMSYLLENEDIWQAPELGPNDCWFDQSGRYLTLMYLTSNVIIDWKERRRVAQYAAEYAVGCLVHDEYWICSENVICRKPFPIIEEVPAMRPTFLNLRC